MFLSDEEDNIIAESLWEINSVIEFDLPEDYLLRSSNFSVTLVYERSEDNIYISTYLDISPGTVWYYSPSISDNNSYLGYKDLLFENIPNHERYCFAVDDYSYNGSQTLAENFSYRYYNENHDALLLLKLDNELDKYIKINDVFNQTNVDLSDMQQCDEKVLASNSNTEPISYSLIGHNEISNCDYSHYDLGSTEVDAGEPVNIEYPANTYDFFRTTIRQIKDNEYWTQMTFGDVPDEIGRIDADFELLKDSPSDFQINAEGTFDVFSSGWEYREKNSRYYYYIHGPKDDTQLFLPKLSNLVKSKYLNLTRDDFSLWYSMIIDYNGISSYSELNSRFAETGYCFYNNPLDHRSKTLWNSSKNDFSEDDIYFLFH